MDIQIRNIDINTDIQAVRRVHAADDHWGSDEACYLCEKTYLESGFLIQVATLDDKIVGHAEWAISQEPAHRFLYLGIMQVHEDYQRHGIGTKLIESGAAYAKANGCTFLRTMPELKTGSQYFYEKCGFTQIADSNRTLKLKTQPAAQIIHIPIDEVPREITTTHPLVIGLYQHSSTHIWHVFNKYSKAKGDAVSAFKIGDAYVNINESDVICWSKQLSTALITEILAIGHDLGYNDLEFCVLNKDVPHFGSFVYEMLDEHDIFMERVI